MATAAVDPNHFHKDLSKIAYGIVQIAHRLTPERMS